MRKILSISLALLILSSHLGFAVGTHYCGGLVVEAKLMIGHEHLDCGMGDMDKPPCKSEPSQTPEFKKKPCCENEYMSMDTQDEVKPIVEQSKVHINFIAAFVVSYIDLFSTDQEKPHHSVYDPPLVERDISILHQVFLI